MPPSRRAGLAANEGSIARPGGRVAPTRLPRACERASAALFVVFAAAHAGVSARACGDVPIVYAF